MTILANSSWLRGEVKKEQSAVKNCLVCGIAFHAQKGVRLKLCSDACKAERRIEWDKRDRAIRREKHLATIAMPHCRVCGSAFHRPYTSRQLLCSDRCKTERLSEVRKTSYRRHLEKQREKSRRYAKQYRENNPEKVQASLRLYRARNRDEILKRGKQYRENNPEKFRAFRKRNYEKNAEMYRAASRWYRENNLEKVTERIREWRRNNPEKRREWERHNHEKLLEQARQRYKNNIEKRREYARQWQKKHLDGRLAYDREYRQKNREKIFERCRQYRLKNVEKRRAQMQLHKHRVDAAVQIYRELGFVVSKRDRATVYQAMKAELPTLEI